MEDASIFLTVGAGILAAIVLIWNAVKAIREAVKPISDFDSRLSALEAEQTESDSKMLSLENMCKMLLKGEVLIASHITDGNHKEQIKEFSDDVSEYLIDNL